MPALLLSLLPLLARVAPDLLGLALGGHASAVAAKVEAALDDVFGTADADQVQAAARTEPAKVDALKVRLDADAEQLKASLADVEGARAATAALVAAKSPLAWGSPVVSAIVVAAFAVVSVVVFARYGVESAVGQLIAGALIAKFGTVVDYWLGSSKGSADRADQVAVLLDRAVAGISPAAKAAPAARGRA